MTKVPAPRLCCLDGVYVVELGPEYSHLYESVQENLAILKQLAHSADSARVVLDMKHVELMGSSIIGYLVLTSQILSDRGGTFATANANKFCQSAISMMQLDSVLPSFESTQAAVDALK